MGSVNISLKKEAYEFLKSLRSRDKSFSDVILELKDSKGNKNSILSVVREKRDIEIVDWKEKEKRMKNFRKSFNERIGKTTKLMKEARKSVKKNDWS